MLAGEAVISQSVFDPAPFAQNLEDTDVGNVVGFAAFINAGGQDNRRPSNIFQAGASNPDDIVRLAGK